MREKLSKWHLTLVRPCNVLIGIFKQDKTVGKVAISVANLNADIIQFDAHSIS